MALSRFNQIYWSLLFVSNPIWPDWEVKLFLWMWACYLDQLPYMLGHNLLILCQPGPVDGPQVSHLLLLFTKCPLGPFRHKVLFYLWSPKGDNQKQTHLLNDHIIFSKTIQVPCKSVFPRIALILFRCRPKFQFKIGFNQEFSKILND